MITKTSRLIRLASSISLVLAGMGLAPFSAAAQVFSVHPAVPMRSAVSAAASVTNAAPIVTLNTGSSPLRAPSLTAASAFAAPVSGPLAPALLAPSAIPAPVAAARAAAAFAPITRAQASRVPASANRVLKDGAERLGAPGTKDASGVQTNAALDALYSGSVPRSAADDAVAPAFTAGRASAVLAAPAEGPRWVFRASTPAPDAPRTTLKRTLSVGYLTGFLGMVVTMALTSVSAAFGWAPHGNYEAPFDTTHAGLGVALSIFLGAAVLAPMAEEVIFRGALQGGLSKLTNKLRLGAFVLPALITSGLFVAVHETADPVLFGVRFVFAYMLSRAFHKEGILASMTAHGTFNAFATAGIVLSAVHLPLIAQAAVTPLALFAAFKAWGVLKAEKPEIKAGTLAPKPFTVKNALLIIPALLAGFLFVMPNEFWLIGMSLLIAWLAAKKFRFPASR